MSCGGAPRVNVPGPARVQPAGATPRDAERLVGEWLQRDLFFDGISRCGFTGRRMSTNSNAPMIGATTNSYISDNGFSWRQS